MIGISYFCQGESHIKAEKVCQDRAYSSADDELSIAIVCDGHGGERYFRSDVGAQMAVEATKECVAEFVRAADSKIFANRPFTQRRAAASEAESADFTKETDADKTLRQLFSSIIYNWHTKIEEHAAATPVSEEERAKVEARYVADFEDNNELEKTYGCTLMCYVYTPSYWFAVHIGDGKCIAFDDKGKWGEPIPWDNNCFLNKTTSLCDSSAIDKFRYCYCGDGSSPLAVFLGSDGIDDSFGEIENMVNFYIQVLKLIAEKGGQEAENTIRETLPQLSKRGSQDDMSVACVYDEDRLAQGIKALTAWQKQEVEAKLSDVNDKIGVLRKRISEFEKRLTDIQKIMIEHKYATEDLAKAFESKRALADKWNIFGKELAGDEFVPYSDEVGFGNDKDK